MITEQLEKEPADMAAVVKRIRTASPNTVISGSIGGSGGIEPLALREEATAGATTDDPQ